jgi:DNA repair exonuclease SbcCD ATPase subunit
MAASKGEQAMNLHLQEIESLQNSLREREKYVTQLENRLRALWDKLEGERKHYMERIKRLEEAIESVEYIINDDWKAAIRILRKAVCNSCKAKEAKPCIKQLKTKSCIYCMKVECECSDFDVSADMGAKG